MRELNTHPFVRDLPPGVREQLSALCKEVHYRPGDVIVQEGRKADRFLLIMEGKASVELHTAGKDPVLLQTLGPGEVAGWSWCLGPRPGAFDVVCREDLRGFEFDGRTLCEAMEARPELGYEVTRKLLGVVSERLEATRLRLLDLYAPGGRR